MDSAEKLKILLAGQSEGVKACCARYGISRTLYYRWLKRYTSLGLAGLDARRKHFTPANKTAPALVRVILDMVRNNPAYGPRELAYRLEDMGHRLGESAVYNVLRRESLSTRAQRQSFASRKEHRTLAELPRFAGYGSGECWLFWTSFCGHFDSVGSLYLYTILDLKSRIACSRLYPGSQASHQTGFPASVQPGLPAGHFHELLEAVAIPVARSLKLAPKCWCLFEHDGLNAARRGRGHAELYDLAHRHGFDVKIHTVDSGIAQTPQAVRQGMAAYNRYNLSELLPFLQDGMELKAVKFRLQKQLRDYNMNRPQDYGGRQLAPLDYHAATANSPKILPVWAYLDRDY